MVKTLNIIGCGRVGKVLGRLFATKGVFALQDVLNRSRPSAEAAVAFLGAGRAVADYGRLRPADVFMLAVPDDQILASCEQLARHGLLAGAPVVFHCSGARPAADMAPVLGPGVPVASVHPVRSFADPHAVVAGFDGTFCSIEGDPAALAVLDAALPATGARVIRVDGRAKTLYHAAAVFACNYVVTLMDIALQAYRAAGVPEATARELLEPLVRENVDNVFRLGPARALTGPIARGDLTTVGRQQAAVDAWHPGYGEVYRALAQATKDLAQRRLEEEEQAPDRS